MRHDAAPAPPVVTSQPTWWGVARGPRRATALDAVGDSVIGAIDFGTPAAAAHFAGAALSEDSLRILRGNNQSALRGTPLPQRFTVRVTDAQGRPVAGVSVRFRLLSGGGTLEGSNQIDRLSNASGLSEAQMTLGSSAGTATVEAAFGNGNKRRVVIFTVTSQ